MSIISITEALAFLDIGTGYFQITAENDVLSMTSSQGGAVNIDIPDLTYEGDDLATALETAMNTNNTLTGTGTLTFSVSYSSTYKFTITIDEGGVHTITIDVSASDAALTFGFTEDPDAASSIESDTAATEDPTAPVQVILDGVDSFVKGYCDRDFESTSYKEYQNGKDKQNLFLKQYPIISVSRLSIGRNDGIKVNNTATSTYATVSVTSTGVVLNKDGTNSTNSPLLFSANATLTDMVTSIKVEDSNWTAEVLNTSYASYASTELIEIMGLQCLNATWAYLEIPDEPESDFEVYADEGYIFKWGGFARGHRNLRIDYTAGYSSADMPDKLKMACLILVKFLYQKREEEIFGRKQYSLGAVRAIILEEGMPSEVRLVLDDMARKDV